MGYRSVKKYIGLNIDSELSDMWVNVRRSMKQSGNAKIEALATATKTAIKKGKDSYSIIADIGHKHGYPVQVESVAQSIDKFNSMTDEQKKEFVAYIFGLKDPRRLLNVIVAGEEMDIHWNSVHKALLSRTGLHAKRIEDVSYGLYLGNNFVVRIQACFTNVIGISAYCQRAFLR